jgi:hypothetical protein
MSLPSHIADLVARSVEVFEAGHKEAAAVILMRGLREHPNEPLMWKNLGHFYCELRRFDAAEMAFKRALGLSPKDADATTGLALALENKGQYDNALMLLSRATGYEPGHLNAKWNRSLLNLSLGNWKKGFQQYEARLEKNKVIYGPRPADMWTGQDVTGKTLYIINEQGIGDSIMFSRFLPMLLGKTKKVYLSAPQNLTALFWEYQLAGVVEFLPIGVPIPKSDYTVFLGSLPYCLGIDKIPHDPQFINRRVSEFLKVAPEAGGRIDLAPIPDSKPGLKIGICWTGNPTQDHNDQRSIPFKLLAGLAGIPNVWLYSLQAPPDNSVIRDEGYEDLVYDLGTECMARGLVSLGTAMKQMDLVITCCTSIAHLAGALDVKTWVLLHETPYWTWGYHDRADNDWYPSVRSFRRKHTDRGWTQVMNKVEEELINMIKMEIM